MGGIHESDERWESSGGGGALYARSYLCISAGTSTTGRAGEQQGPGGGGTQTQNEKINPLHRHYPRILDHNIILFVPGAVIEVNHRRIRPIQPHRHVPDLPTPKPVRAVIRVRQCHCKILLVPGIADIPPQHGFEKLGVDVCAGWTLQVEGVVERLGYGVRDGVGVVAEDAVGRPDAGGKIPAAVERDGADPEIGVFGGAGKWVCGVGQGVDNDGVTLAWGC